MKKHEQKATNATMIRELPADERPREKLQKNGAGCLSNAELLAILIGNGTRDTSAIMLAQRILSIEKEGITYLGSCTVSELCGIRGMGIAKSSQIVAAIELGKRLAAKPAEKRLNMSEAKFAAKLFQEEMRYLKKEIFNVLLLNARLEIISIEEISVGNLNSSVVHPREVFSAAVKKCAASVILVHNHPSGNPTPSSMDIETTERLVEAGRLLGIEVLDHIIIGDGTFCSLREKMLM